MTLPSYALARQRRINREKKQKAAQAAERKAVEIEHAQATTVEDAVCRVRDAEWAEKIGQTLVRHYPGRGWQVEVNTQGGVANIYNAHVSGKYGWVLKLKDIRENSFSRDMKRIGGEMLERSRLSRGRFDEAEVTALQRAITGCAKVDLS